MKTPSQRSTKSFWVLISICITGLISVAYACLVYFNHYDISTVSTKTEDWTLFSTLMSGVIGPIIALWTMLLTGWIAFEFNEYQKDKNDHKDRLELQQLTIDLFKEFRSEKGLKTRHTASEMRKLWKGPDSEKFLKVFVKHMVLENGFTYDGRKISEEQIHSVYDLFAFYNLLSLYPNNNENVRNLNFFYYGFWRSFLYAVAFAYDNERQKRIFQNPNSPKEFRESFVNDIRFANNLRRLDMVCGFDILNDSTDATTIIEFYDNADYC